MFSAYTPLDTRFTMLYMMFSSQMGINEYSKKFCGIDLLQLLIIYFKKQPISHRCHIIREQDIFCFSWIYRELVSPEPVSETLQIGIYLFIQYVKIFSIEIYGCVVGE